jgi:salicylate hydroxylase
MLGRLLAHNDTNLSNVAHALTVYQHLRLPAAQLAAERSQQNGHMYEFNDPDYCFDDTVKREQLEALGEAVGASFHWLAYGGCEEDWATAEKLLRDGMI